MNLSFSSRTSALLATFAVVATTHATQVFTANLGAQLSPWSSGSSSDDDDSHQGIWTQENDDDDDDGGGSWNDCGNGVLDRNEECDDGNGDNTDACTNRCHLAQCGDKYVQPHLKEECDDGNRNNKDDCINTCKKATCGDGYKQKNSAEECDKGERNGLEGVKCSVDCKKVDDDDDDSGHSGGTSNDSVHQAAPSDDTTVTDDSNDQSGNENDDDDASGANSDPILLESDVPQINTLDPLPAQQDDKELPLESDSQSSKRDHRQADEMRKKREAMRKKLEETMMFIEEHKDDHDDDHAEEEDDDEQEETEETDAAEEIEGEPEEEVVQDVEPPKTALRCFTADGELTTNRSDCDAQQSTILKPEVIDEDIAKERIRKKLLGEDIANKQRAELIETMQDARARLRTLSEGAGHSEEVSLYLSDSIAWLDRSITYFSEGPKNIDEIKQMVAPVKQLLTQAKALIQKEKALPTERVDIMPIVAKTERLLLKFRESFVALAQGGVQLDQNALSAYIDAAGKFEEIRTACAVNSKECSRLNGVLEILKSAQGPLQEAFGTNPEIYEKVQAKFN